MSEKKELTFEEKVHFLFQGKRYPEAWDKLKVTDERIKQMIRLCCRKLQAFPYIQEGQWPAFMAGMYFQTKTSKEPLFFGQSPLRLAYLSGALENLVVYTVDKMGKECGSMTIPSAVIVESWRKGAKKSNKTDLPIQKLKAEHVALVTPPNDILPYRFIKSEKKYENGNVVWKPTKASAWYTDPHQRLLTAAIVRHLRHLFPDIFFGAVIKESTDDAERPEISAEERAKSWAGNNTGGMEIDNQQVNQAIDRSKQQQNPPPSGSQPPVEAQDSTLPPWPEDNQSQGQQWNQQQFEQQINQQRQNQPGQQSMNDVLDTF